MIKCTKIHKINKIIGYEFGDLSYRYYVFDDFSSASQVFNITAELTYFYNSYVCATSGSEYSDIENKIAVVRDYNWCSTSLKIGNAQRYGEAALVIRNTCLFCA